MTHRVESMPSDALEHPSMLGKVGLFRVKAERRYGIRVGRDEEADLTRFGVLRVGAFPDWPRYGNFDPGFLGDFPYHGFLRSFTGLDLSTWKSPVVIVGFDMPNH